MSAWGLVPGVATLAITWMIGYNIVAAFVRAERYFLASIGWMVGSGLVSLTVFAIHLCGGNLHSAFVPVQAVLLVASIVLRRRLAPSLDLAKGDVGPAPRSPVAWLLWLLLVVLCGSALVRGLATPAIWFDELHNWGFKALSTALHGRPFQGYWPFTLFPNHIPFVASTVHVCLQEPRETLTHLVPFFFLLSTLGCFHYGTIRISGRTHWGLPLTVLLALGVYELFPNAERVACDLPLAALTLAGVVFAAIWLQTRRTVALVFSGLLCGLCVWTKTEGMMIAAAVGTGAAIGGWANSHRMSRLFKDGLAWLAAAVLVAAPWYLFLWLREVGMASSGHLGSFHFERWPGILNFTRRALLTDYALPLAAYAAFLVAGLRKGNRGVQAVFLVVVAAGFAHAVLPIFMLPEGAFLGWWRFMMNGLDRYLLHFAPVMVLSVAAAGGDGRLGPLDRVFRLAMRTGSGPGPTNAAA